MRATFTDLPWEIETGMRVERIPWSPAGFRRPEALAGMKMLLYEVVIEAAVA